MSHNITEVDAFTTPVVVPDGTDDHMLLSSYILAFVQALTNRSLNAKNLHSALNGVVTALAAHTALTDAANTFTVAPQKVNDNNGNRPLLTTDKTCQDDPTSPNLWKRILEFPTPDTGKWRLFTGQAGGDEQFALTMNAAWAVGSQHWVADDTGAASIALTFGLSSYGGLRIARRAAGAGSWTDWNFSGGGSGNLVVNDQILAGGDISTGGDFTRSSPPTTEFLVPIFDAIGADNGSGVGFTLDYDQSGVAYLKGSGNSKVIEVAFRLPVGGTFSKAEMMADVTGDLVGVIYRRDAYDWSGPGTPTETQLGGTMGVIGHGGGLAVYDTGAISETVARDAEYRFSFHAGTSVKIYGLRVTCTEPGPRN